MKTLIDPTAAEKIEAARPRLKSGSWGGTETVCMMSALVNGADSTDACVTAGWPEWLAELNVSLFDAIVGAECEQTARYQFALDVAKAVQEPRDYDKARDLFLIATLNRAKEHDTAGVCQRVIDLLHRRIGGGDVANEMRAAHAASDAASDAADAAYAASDAAADAAAYAAYAAADAARNAADAAADAAYSARAASRNDLITALNAA